MKRNVVKIFLILIILIVLSLFFKGYLYKNEIANNRKETVCKFVQCRQYPKTTKSFFIYYVDKKLHRNSYGNCPSNYNQLINNYFLMYYSSEDSDKIEVDFSKVITDTTAIINAGFAKDDL